MFSVLMSVYNGESVENFIQAMESVLNQTLKAPEIILIRDGCVYKELQDVIDKYVAKYGEISYHPLNQNSGLGKALRFGVEVASYNLIFRMDTDDIACHDRFEKQYSYMQRHPEIDVLGGQILEFTESTNNILAKREVPIEHHDICSFLKKRNPFNHMTIAFKKEKVINCGNYMDLHFLEDYYLWCRMFLNNCVFHNLEDVLVYARVGENMYQRRGGIKYFEAWKKLESFKLANKITNRVQYFMTLSMRFITQVLVPNKLRGYIIINFSRRKIKSEA